jgi:hypothetical protein
MNSSLTKSRIFALLALGILLYFFVIPAVFTHNVVELAAEGKADKYSSLPYKVWDYYRRGVMSAAMSRMVRPVIWPRWSKTMGNSPWQPHRSGT